MPSGLVVRLIHLCHITICLAIFQQNYACSGSFLILAQRFNVRLHREGNKHKKGARVLNCSLLCIACTNRLTNLKALTHYTHYTHYTHLPSHSLSHSLPLSVALCPSFPALEITSKRAGSLEERGSGIQLQWSSWEGPTGGADTPPPVTLSP